MEILDFLRQNKNVLQQKFKVKRIGLFGSYATDEQNVDSEIDIIVNMPSTFDGFFDLKEYLESNLKVSISGIWCVFEKRGIPPELTCGG